VWDFCHVKPPVRDVLFPLLGVSQKRMFWEFHNRSSTDTLVLLFPGHELCLADVRNSDDLEPLSLQSLPGSLLSASEGCGTRASGMSSPSHSVWVDMYYRRPRCELRPLVDRLLDQCEDVDGFMQKARDRSKNYVDLGMIDTMCNGLRRAKKARELSENNVDFGVIHTGPVCNGLKQLQADEELKCSRVRTWLTELDVNPSNEGRKLIGDGMPLHEAQSRSPPIRPGDSASNCPSPPDSGEQFAADQCILQKVDASGLAISVSAPAARTFLAGGIPAVSR